MIDHRQIERIAIVHHLPHQPRRRHRFSVVAHRHDARILHRRDFRERLALASHRRRANRPDAHGSPFAAARSTMPRVTDALSFTGCVLGMQQTAVNPPRAAARVPVSIVSDISWPGSRRWQCKSMNPGATMNPFRVEYLRAFAAEPATGSRPTSAISPAIQQNVHCSIRLAGGIDHAAILNQ